MLEEKERIRLIFALKVKYLRVKNDFSYHRLSDATGLSKSYIHDIEKGRKYPKIDKINALAAALGVTYDELVATSAPGKIKPIVDLLNSDFLKAFPLELFGLDLYRLFDLFSATPDKINAFISTVIKITRNYQLTNEHFYAVALRSYQEMHDNYFPELEQAAQHFATRHGLDKQQKLVPDTLIDLLQSEYGIRVDRRTLDQRTGLNHLRSYFSEQHQTLYLNEGFSHAQKNFLLGREIAFQELAMSDRPFMTRLAEVKSFDQLLNNFRASYFAVALLANEHDLTRDLDHILSANSWNSTTFMELTQKYSLTPEMLFQRMTNVLPEHFGIRDLFFLRLRADESLEQCDLTKELHLSQLHNPYGNLREEHYCRRWNSIQVIKQLKAAKSSTAAIDIQISNYWQSDRSYLCISLAHTDRAYSKKGVSLTIGMLVNDQLKYRLGFLRNGQINERTVHTTCERCSVPDCQERMRPATILEQEKMKNQLQEAIAEIELR